MSKKVVKDIALKMGMKSPTTIRKAEELAQLVDIRVGSSSLTALNLTGSCPMVMCLEMAASSTGSHVNRADAIRLSGVNKKIYANGIKALESMLGLQGAVTIKDLAVQFGCTGSTDLALQTLKSYTNEYYDKSCTEIDFTTPLFQVTALCAACRKMKQNVDWNKLREVCSVKRSTFDKLVQELEKHAGKILEAQGKKSSQNKRSRNLLDDVEKHFQEEEMKTKVQRTEDETGEKDDFEEWKKRILAAASKTKMEKDTESNVKLS